MIKPSRLKPLVPGTLCLLVCLGLPVNGKSIQTDTDSSAQLRQAEATASQIVAQFHRDLDFKDIFAQHFVTDPKLRHRIFFFDDEDKWKQFDLPTRERAYVALMTFLHLWEEYLLIQKQNDKPPGIDDNKEPALLSSSPPKTMAELNQAIADIEGYSNIYRKQFPKGIFESAQYRASIAEAIKSASTYHHNVPRIEKGNAKFGIPESVPVYVVRPEEFDYYFIRENGAMKLFHVDILPNLRLF